MRSFCTCIAVAGLLASLSVSVPGCGGQSELEKPPEVKAGSLSVDDMPGYKDMQNSVKNTKTK